MRGLIAMLMAGMVALGAAAEERVFDFGEAAALEGWLTDTDSWRIEDGALRQPMVGLRGTRAFWPEAFSDVAIEVRVLIRPEGDGVRAPGVIYRAVDERTYYYIHFDSKNRQVVWVRSSSEGDWAEARRHREIALPVGEWLTARVEAVGSEHRVYLNGTLLFTEDDATISAGIVGLRAGQGDISFDDLRVEGTLAELAEEFTLTRVPFFTVCADGGGPGAYEAFPDLCMTDRGELLCVFYAGYGHISFPREDLPNGGFIAMVRSRDLGATWSAAEVVVDAPVDVRVPSIAQLWNGVLLVTCMTFV